FVERVQAAFSTWLQRRFGPMSTLPYLPRPVLGHHVPHYLAHHLGQPGTERVALLVIDGMAIDQWRILRDTLDGHNIDEHAIFSWIPTLTQIGRQAIFSGRVPMEFATSIDGTHREPIYWSNFWQAAGLKATEIAYCAPQGDREPFEQSCERLLQASESPKIRVIGAVVTMIDQNLHGVVGGSAALNAVVEQWAHSQKFAVLVNRLLEVGYIVFVTADHGNVAARGIGKPNVGVTAQQRGERAH